MSKTADAFDRFRNQYPAKACDMSRVANSDELVALDLSDGVRQWVDGAGAEKGATPLINPKPPATQLWVVRPDDVVHAREDDAASAELESKVIKHSNLTGGADAHCGGELLFCGENVIALNGASGRYGPSSVAEMTAVAHAFRSSGYGVWSYGFSEETMTAYRFGDRDPEWVA
ncbi:hypothetical protein [Sphingomonas sp. TREG-RG-20F-R18-01]|uniref:hypothetical protein n=1 Tax=Sphingomonas sp. TREG-RG-20F-R18-01 TaxID=2914982 RepID=UPI001F58262D|nr:hypothetical protein [Sphingomonas sp. TREG-RG-20F-R18-01]